MTQSSRRPMAPGGVELADEVRPFLASLAESVALLLLMIGAEAMFFGSGYFASLALHPFWIVVLLAALQHGVFVGVTTAGLATLLMDWPDRQIGADLSIHYLEASILPLQWLVAALCVGLVRQMQIRASRHLVSENARLTEMNAVLAGEVKRLDAIIRRMELDAVTRPLQLPGASLLAANLPQAASRQPGMYPVERMAEDDSPHETPAARVDPVSEALAALSESAAPDLGASFGAAAGVLLGRPASLLLRSDMAGFQLAPGAEGVAGLRLPLPARSKLAAAAMAARHAAVFESSNPRSAARGRFVVSAVRLDGAGSGDDADRDPCAALIVTALDDDADAGILAHAIDRLAGAVASALATDASRAMTRHGSFGARLGRDG